MRPTTEVIQRDTIITERVVHDTAFVSIPLERENVTITTRKSHLENHYAKSDASIDTLGMLHHSLETIPQKIPVPIVTLATDTKVVTGLTRTIEVPIEKPLKWWQKILMVLGVLNIVYVLAKVGLILIKK